MGSPSQNRVYCTKQDSRDNAPGSGPYEFGECPADSGKRKDFQGAVTLLRQRGCLAEVAATYPLVYVQYHNGLLRLLTECARPRNFQTIVKWYWGASGTGKSRKALEDGLLLSGADPTQPPAIDKMPYYKASDHKWWGGYYGQQVVIIDDFRPGMLSYDYLLRLFDRYPVKVEAKGTEIEFNSKYIIVTSDKHPAAYYPEQGPVRILQLFRRLDTIQHFTHLPGHEPDDIRRALRFLEEYEAEFGSMQEFATAAANVLETFKP